jgi:hypothetical protein
MNLTNTQRALKLAKALITEPNYMPRYLLSNFSKTRNSPLS